MAIDRAVALLLALVLAVSVVRAKEQESDESSVGQKDQIDTENIFGFVLGSDIGEVGEKEIQPAVLSSFGKGSGSYLVNSPSLEYGWVPMENLRLAASVNLARYDISRVADLSDQSQWALQSVSFDARYRFVDRDRAGFGLTLDAEPHWGGADETSGELIDGYGGDFALILDRELIPNRLVAAFNLLYSPDISRSHATGLWSREATAGFAGGLMYRITPGVMMGAEGRYLRKYEGLGLDNFAGHALFLGPTLYTPINQRVSVTTSWAIQVAGRGTDAPGSLDLTNFPHHQFRIEIDVGL